MGSPALFNQGEFDDVLPGYGNQAPPPAPARTGPNALYNQGGFGNVLPGFYLPQIGVPFGPYPGSISYRALRLAGYIMTGVVPEPEMIIDALGEANAMLDEWNTDQLTQQFIDDRYFAINTSQQSYTLGPTGNFNVDIYGIPLLYRPQRIIRANLILLNDTAQPTRIPIKIIQVDDFADIPVIDISSQVIIRMYVQTTHNNVTLWMFPFPTVGNQLELFMWPGTRPFVNISSVLVDNNPGCLNAIVYNLAERMIPYVSKNMGGLGEQRIAWLHRMAVKTKTVFDSSNLPSPSLTPDLITEMGGSEGAPFDYLTGDWSQ